MSQRCYCVSYQNLRHTVLLLPVVLTISKAIDCLSIFQVFITTKLILIAACVDRNAMHRIATSSTDHVHLAFFQTLVCQLLSFCPMRSDEVTRGTRIVVCKTGRNVGSLSKTFLCALSAISKLVPSECECSKFLSCMICLGALKKYMRTFFQV